MQLIITHSIKKFELNPASDHFSLDAIKASAKRVWEGLGEDIKNPIKISETKLKKIYLTSSSGAGRAIFLLQIPNQKSVLVMLKLKSDKKIGSNMTVKNKNFRKALEENLDLILADLQSGNYDEYAI